MRSTVTALAEIGKQAINDIRLGGQKVDNVRIWIWGSFVFEQLDVYERVSHSDRTALS